MFFTPASQKLRGRRVVCKAKWRGRLLGLAQVPEGSVSHVGLQKKKKRL